MDIEQAEHALAKADPILGNLIKSQTLEPLKPRTDYFASLSNSIISQQVSLAAARAIFGRFKDVTQLKPQAAKDLSDEAAKTIGLSKQKTSYIKDLAIHFTNNPAVYDHLSNLPDDEVIKDLTAIRGIGPWTAQMFLLFTLGRANIFAPDDVGLQRAMMQLYKWEELPARKDLVEHAEAWKPYRSVASLHLWKLLEK